MVVQTSSMNEANAMIPLAPAENQVIQVRTEPPLLKEYTPPGLSASPDLGSLLRSLRRRWMSAFTLSTLFSMIAGVAAFSLLSPSYTAFSQIKVLPYDPFVLSNGLVQSSSPTSYMKSQAAYLKSHVILQKAAKDDKIRNMNLEAQVGSLPDYFEKNLVVEFQESSELITVKFSAEEPTKAKAIVQAITDAYRDYVEYNEKQTRGKRVDELTNARSRLLAEIGKKREQLRNSKVKDVNMTKESLERHREELITGMRDLRTARLEQNREISKIRGQLAALKLRRVTLAKYEVNDPAVEAAVDADPTCRELIRKIEQIKGIVRTFEERHSGTTPTRTSAEKLMATRQQMLDDRRNQLRDDLKRKAETRAEHEYAINKDELERTLVDMEKKEKELADEFDKFKDQLAKLSGSTSEIDQIHEEIQQKQHMVESVTTAMNKLEIDLTSPFRVSVLQEADVQAKDSKKQMLAAIASPVGVTAVVCMALAWSDFRRRRLYSASEVSRGLGMRVLGVIPHSANLEQHVLDVENAPEMHGQSVMEWIDGIRTVVIHDAQMDGSKVLLVSSADSREGKSSLAGHLAASLARAGRRTLLIDGDLRRPFLHEMFNLPMHPGLSELLVAETEVASAIYETPEEFLAVMPSGQWGRQVIQALSRNELGQLLQGFRQSYDFVIIDSHPILDATDTLLMSKQVDGVILSAIKQQTQLPRLYTAYQRLASLHVNVLGVVVNGVDPFEVPVSSGGGPAQNSVPLLTSNL